MDHRYPARRKHFTTVPVHLLYLLAGLLGGIFFVYFCKNIIFNCGIMHAHSLCCFIPLEKYSKFRRDSSIIKNILNTSHIRDSKENVVQRRINELVRDIRHKRNNKFLLIGVMTARRYIRTRVAAAYRTWVPSIPGRVIFFSREGTPPYSDIPIIPLKTVDDSYPPQRKSFTMLRFMHDNFIDDYEWFMRVDDDIYIQGHKLELFLRSINSLKTWFIGQAGTGTSVEEGGLNLKDGENYCMGGPGMIFSRSTLRMFSLNSDKCLRSLESTHEDVEVGRCVKKYAGVACTWAFEMQQLFYHNYIEEKGSFTHELNQNALGPALTLHPVKKAPYVFRIHNYVKTLHMMRANTRRVQLMREMHKCDLHLKDNQREGKSIYSHNLAVEPSFILENHTNDYIWDFSSKHFIYSHNLHSPRVGLTAEWRVCFNESIEQALLSLNSNPRSQPRTLIYNTLSFSYTRLHPLNGLDLIVDMILLQHRRQRHKSVYVPIRRRLFLHRALLDPKVISFGSDFVNVPVYSTNSSSALLEDTHRNELIHFIVPLYGRLEAFRRFLSVYENECLKKSFNVSLRVVLFRSNVTTDQPVIRLIKRLQVTYRWALVKLIQTEVSFSRGYAFELGMSALQMNSLLFFVDVDVHFKSTIFSRIYRSVFRGRSAYFPILFTQYNPDTVDPCNDTHCRHESMEISNKSVRMDIIAGSWRTFGYGIVSIYKSDFKRVGGFNESIRGWGKEDVDLYEKVVSSNMTVLRSYDPDLIHIYHPVVCDSSMPQYLMCKASRSSSYASQSYLAQTLSKILLQRDVNS